MLKSSTAQISPSLEPVESVRPIEAAGALRGKLVDGNVVSNAPPPSSPTPNTWIGPWIAVPYLNFGAPLFGFVTRHPNDPALSWASLGPIAAFDKVAAVATTLRDLHVKVGHQIEMDDLPKQGLEAMVAFRLSFGFGPALEEIVPRLVTVGASKRWLHACVWARHLLLPCPEPLPGAVDKLLATTSAAWSAYCGEKKKLH